MNHKSGAISLLWVSGKQDTLAGKGILALGVGLLALALAVVAIVVVMPLADHQVSPGIAAGIEAGSARWSALGELYTADTEGSNGAGIAQAMAPDEAFVRSVALVGQNLAGYAVAGPCNSPVCSLSMGPTDIGAYTPSLALAGDEAFVRSVALVGQNLAGYAVAGPCNSPVCSLSMDPTDIGGYAPSLALAGRDSVALVGGR